MMPVSEVAELSDFSPANIAEGPAEWQTFQRWLRGCARWAGVAGLATSAGLRTGGSCLRVDELGTNSVVTPGKL